MIGARNMLVEQSLSVAGPNRPDPSELAVHAFKF